MDLFTQIDHTRHESSEDTNARAQAHDAPAVVTGKSCVNCHATNLEDANHCQSCGCFLPSNNVSPVIHGGRRRRQLADPEQGELFQSWASDLGGVEVLTAGQRVLLRRAAEADSVCCTAFLYLSTTQQSWSSRRVQTALLVLAQHSQTIFRVAALLGIKRENGLRNPLDAVRHAVEAANR